MHRGMSARNRGPSGHRRALPANPLSSGPHWAPLRLPDLCSSAPLVWTPSYSSPPRFLSLENHPKFGGLGKESTQNGLGGTLHCRTADAGTPQLLGEAISSLDVRIYERLDLVGVADAGDTEGCLEGCICIKNFGASWPSIH